MVVTRQGWCGAGPQSKTAAAAAAAAAACCCCCCHARHAAAPTGVSNFASVCRALTFGQITSPRKRRLASCSCCWDQVRPGQHMQSDPAWQTGLLTVAILYTCSISAQPADAGGAARSGHHLADGLQAFAHHHIPCRARRAWPDCPGSGRRWARWQQQQPRALAVGLGQQRC